MCVSARNALQKMLPGVEASFIKRFHAAVQSVKHLLMGKWLLDFFRGFVRIKRFVYYLLRPG